MTMHFTVKVPKRNHMHILSVVLTHLKVSVHIYDALHFHSEFEIHK